MLKVMAGQSEDIARPFRTFDLVDLGTIGDAPIPSQAGISWQFACLRAHARECDKLRLD